MYLRKNIAPETQAAPTATSREECRAAARLSPVSVDRNRILSCFLLRYTGGYTTEVSPVELKSQESSGTTMLESRIFLATSINYLLVAKIGLAVAG